MINDYQPETIPQYVINASLETGEFIGEPVYVGEVIPKNWDEKLNTADAYFCTYLHFCTNAQQQKTGKTEIRAIGVAWV